MTDKQYRFRLRVLIILSFLGVLVTAYLIYQHYKPAGGSFCDISDYVSCDIVNKSVYSEIFGIPVSILGFLTYTVFFFGTIGLLRKGQKTFLPGFTILAAIALLFSLFLTYIEFFVLRAICILCITQQILIFLIFIISLTLWSKNRKLARSS